MKYEVVERFVSINGEARRAGQLAVFIRFRICNLNCSYCDTKWANNTVCPCEIMSLEDITEYIKSTGVKNVTLTGGEPLLQKNIKELIEAIGAIGCRVEIETNGSQSIKELSNCKYRPSFTLDYKSPSSGMESHMLIDNYNYLDNSDTVKFVCGSIADLDKAREIITKYDLTNKCAVYISPVFGTLELEKYVEYMQKYTMNDVNFQLQMHKFIWSPDKKGV